MDFKFCDATLRDGQQSLAATRMTTEQALRVLPLIDQAGYDNIELWGGAVLDSGVRFLNENPWDRLETYKQVLGGATKIKALLRGQNLFAYQPYPDDLVIAFVKEAVKSGVHVMRVFDALNDERNLMIPILAAKAAGALVEAAVCYTTSPVHTNDYFVNYAAKLADLGADRIVVKDMAAILHPLAARTLFKDLRNRIDLPLVLHSHDTTGVGIMNAVLAMKYGVNLVDTCITPFAGGSSHPPIEMLIPFAEELGIDHGLDVSKIMAAQAELFKVYDELIQVISYKNDYYQPVNPADIDREEVRRILALIDDDTDASLLKALDMIRQMERDLRYPPYDDRLFESQIPGGMLSNLNKQLKDMGMSERMDEVAAEIPNVRKDVGYVPLVTPTSQIVGSQAAFNVIGGERYHFLSNEIRMLVRGEFGRTPAPCSETLIDLALPEGEEPLKYRPAFYLPPVMDNPINAPFVKTYKDKLLHLMLGKAADDYLKKHYGMEA